MHTCVYVHERIGLKVHIKFEHILDFKIKQLRAYTHGSPAKFSPLMQLFIGNLM